MMVEVKKGTVARKVSLNFKLLYTQNLHSQHVLGPGRIGHGPRVRGDGVLPYMSHIGMCRPKGYHFQHFGLK